MPKTRTKILFTQLCPQELQEVSNFTIQSLKTYTTSEKGINSRMPVMAPDTGQKREEIVVALYHKVEREKMTDIALICLSLY